VKLVEPPVTPLSGPFWDATRDRRLVLQWCVACERAIHYPRAVCPSCAGSRLTWREAAGVGQVHAVSVQHRPAIGRDPDDGPYAVVLVDLPEGVRLMSNVVGCEPDEVAVGMAVRLTWLALSDGRNLPVFEPAG
jgi:uncharacterized OB-fold protein